MLLILYKRGVVMSDAVSLTMGNSVLPLGDGLVGHAELLRQLLLREVLFPALVRDVAADDCLVHSECLLR